MIQLPLRPIEFQILLILADKESHGYSIIQETNKRTGGKVRLQPGTLYRAIQRLEDAGLIRESAARPSRESDDQRRRYFALTKKGRSIAADEARRLSDLVRESRDAGLIEGRS